MDTDCVICFGSHYAAECAERTEQHCPDCYSLIRSRTDHTSVCASKSWIFKKYANLYAQQLKERCIVSTNAPFRYLKNTCWQKPEEGLEMYSPVNGAFVELKSDRDISLSTTRFESFRLMVVVKQKEHCTETFEAKLLLYTTKKTMIMAADLSGRFDRNAYQTYERDTTLILAVSADDEPCFNINVFPTNSAAREYRLRFDKVKKTFSIPSGLLAGSAHDHTVVVSQLNYEHNANQQVVRSYNDGNLRIGNETSATPSDVRRLDNCFECHAPVRSANDHVPTCGAKNWFVSKFSSVY